MLSVCSRGPQHLNLGTIDILCCVCVGGWDRGMRARLILCIIECLAASLTPTHCTPVTHPSPSVTNKNDPVHYFLEGKTTWYAGLQVRGLRLR